MTTMAELMETFGPDYEVFAEVMWTPGDVQSLAKLTEEEALDFLVDNQKRIRDRLVELGWEVISDLLDDWLQEQKQGREDYGE